MIAFQSVLAVEDLRVGDSVEGEILQLVDAGAIVRLTPRLTALVPVAHWADVAPTTAQVRPRWVDSSLH